MRDQDATIQNRLREFRKLHHLSQEDLAASLGISRQSVIALEQGRFMPSLPLVVNLCQFFNTAFEEIFEFERQISDEMDQILNDNPQNKIKIISSKENIINSYQAGEEAKTLAELGEKEANMPFELEPWKPFREAVSLRDAMDRLFEESVVTPVKGGVAMPKIDIQEKKDAVVVKAEIPGVAEEDVEVEITDNIMTISGEKKEEKVEEKEGYHYKESHTGTFTRSFSLPSEVAAEKADADMKNGILTITIPKVEAKKPKKVQIKKKA